MQAIPLARAGLTYRSTVFQLQAYCHAICAQVRPQIGLFGGTDPPSDQRMQNTLPSALGVTLF